MSAIAASAPRPDTSTLRRTLDQQLAADEVHALCVAYSGGPDSSALLHALAGLPEARKRSLRALHIDHGLHPASAGWATHCAAFCSSLEVPLQIVRVDVRDDRGEGIEAAARCARRSVFAETLGDGEWLTLAHHRDDQIETVLLKLLRGAGPEGLGGMRTLCRFGSGWLWRPLLDITRNTLNIYLNQNNIEFIDDPANHDPRFARNVVRNDILPDLTRHWPHAGTSILHAAGLCRAAADHIEREARAALAPIQRGDTTLDTAGWLALPEALRAPVLHRWLRALGLPAPGDAAYRQLQHQATSAAADTLPCVNWPGTEVRIWDGRLHATPPLATVPGDWEADWDGTPLILPVDCGSLTLATSDGKPAAADAACFDPPLRVCLRRGGERIKPAGDTHTRELRDLFQRDRIPPWLRTRCPLIWAGEELIAVADLWISAHGEAVFDRHGLRPFWSRPNWLNDS